MRFLSSADFSVEIGNRSFSKTVNNNDVEVLRFQKLFCVTLPVFEEGERDDDEIGRSSIDMFLYETETAILRSAPDGASEWV